MSAKETVYELAKRLNAAGISTVPIRQDKPKAAAVDWKEFIERLPTAIELSRHFSGKNYGIAAIGGKVSGGLECIDFDEVGLIERWMDDVDMAAPGMLKKLVIVKTPKGGGHAWFRSPACEHNQPLASRPPTEDELRESPRLKSVKRIETRGAGGYALIPGCPPGCHPSGREYTYNAIGLRDLARVQKISVDERTTLVNLARAYNTLPIPPATGQQTRPQSQGGITPWDDYDRRGPSWPDLLEPAGWKLEGGDWDQGRLTRPGKSSGVSATIGVCRDQKTGDPLLNVFSSSAGIEVGTYGKFRTYAAFFHNGDQSAAAKDVYAKGFGERAKPAAKTANAEPAETSKFVLVSSPLAGRKVKPVRFLIDGKVPTGKVTMIAGVGGMGKSTLTRHMIACLTTGRPAFGLDYKTPPPCDVLLASVEDSPEDTIIPHLIAEGADLSRVRMVDGVRCEDDKGRVLPFDVRCLNLVIDAVKANPSIRMLIIDPIMSFVGRAGINENASAEVRTILDPLIAMAEETGISVILIAHLNKSTGSTAINRIVGSAAFRDACRVVYTVGHDPNDGDRRVMALVKENVPGLDRSSIVFTRVAIDPASELAAKILMAPEFSELDAADQEKIAKQLAIIKTLGRIDCDADAVLSANKAETPSENKAEACCDWIREFLKDFAYPVDEVQAGASKAGFKKWIFNNAKTALGRKGTGEMVFKLYGGDADGTWWIGLGPWTQWTKRPEIRTPSVSDSKSGKNRENLESEKDAIPD